MMESSVHKMPLITPEVPEFAWTKEPFEGLCTACETLVREGGLPREIEIVMRRALEQHTVHKMGAQFEWNRINKGSIQRAEEIASDPAIGGAVIEARMAAEENLRREKEAVLEVLQTSSSSVSLPLPRDLTRIAKKIFNERAKACKGLIAIENGKYQTDIADWSKKIKRVEACLQEMVKNYYILLFYAKQIEFLTDKEVTETDIASKQLNEFSFRIWGEAKDVAPELRDSLSVEELSRVTQVGDWLAEEAGVDGNQHPEEVPLAVVVTQSIVITADKTRLGVLHSDERAGRGVRHARQKRFLASLAQEVLKTYTAYWER